MAKRKTNGKRTNSKLQNTT